MHKRVDMFKDSLTEYVASMYNTNEYLIEEANYKSILLAKMENECSKLKNFFMDCAKFANSFPTDISSSSSSSSIANIKDESSKAHFSTTITSSDKENEPIRSNLVENAAVLLNSKSDGTDTSKTPMKKQKTAFRGLQSIN